MKKTIVSMRKTKQWHFTGKNQSCSIIFADSSAKPATYINSVGYAITHNYAGDVCMYVCM
jgi:hypothetical protein